MSDPFSVLGLPAQFALPSDMIAARKRDLSRALHPDRYVGRPSSERREALTQALMVNEAARVLENPIARAEALLARAGHVMHEGQEPQPDPEFLMDIMELRQELRAAGQARDESSVMDLMKRVETSREQVMQELTRELSKLDKSSSFDSKPAFVLVGTLRYYQRFFDEAGAILDEIA